jgi:Zn-dependent M16 (insulinase) family peptidase
MKNVIKKAVYDYPDLRNIAGQMIEQTEKQVPNIGIVVLVFTKDAGPTKPVAIRSNIDTGTAVRMLRETADKAEKEAGKKVIA